jgi:hypothetical protein
LFRVEENTMSSQDDPPGSVPVDPGDIRERLRENAQLIERTERALQAIARTFDETRSGMGLDEVGSGPWEHDPDSEVGAKVDAMLQRIVFDLIGVAEQELAPSSHPAPDDHGSKAVRRPGQYRQFI